MPDGLGYLKFDAYPVLDKGGALLSIGDHVLKGEIRSWNETIVPAGLTLQTHGHTTILQLPYTGADAPFTMQPASFDMEILFTHEDDARRLNSHARLGLPFVMLVNWPFTDGWTIKGGAPSQTLWRTSRRVSWGLAGVTHTSHPPRAYVDGVELAYQGNHEAAVEAYERAIELDVNFGRAYSGLARRGPDRRQ